jgi:hypothetical protein
MEHSAMSAKISIGMVLAKTLPSLVLVTVLVGAQQTFEV